MVGFIENIFRFSWEISRNPFTLGNTFSVMSLFSVFYGHGLHDRDDQDGRDRKVGHDGRRGWHS